MRWLATVFFFTLISLPALGMKVDVHAHAEVADTTGKSPAELTAAMAARGLDKVILMTTPSALAGLTENDSGDIASFFSSEILEGKIKLMYGGEELNHLIHSVGRIGSIADSHRWDADNHSAAVFPNGCTSAVDDCASEIWDAAYAAFLIEGEGTSGATYSTFMALAEAAAASGSYVGFGEMGANHVSRRPGHPYVRFPANHAWMKDLADIAAAAGMVIDLHFEVDAANKSELDDLLNHNPDAIFVLEHAGWSSSGTTNYHSVIRELIEDHPNNLYVALKECDLTDGSGSCYHSSSNIVSSDWEDLILDHYDRFMIGSDAKYWQDASLTVQETMDYAFRDRSAPNDKLGSLRLLRNRILSLSPTAAAAIEGGTAAALFGFTSAKRPSLHCGGSVICRKPRPLVPAAWRKGL